MMVYQVTYTLPMSSNSPGWSGGDPDDFTALTLVRLAQVMQKVFTATLAPFGLPPHQFSVLLHLIEHPGIDRKSVV